MSAYGIPTSCPIVVLLLYAGQQKSIGFTKDLLCTVYIDGKTTLELFLHNVVGPLISLVQPGHRASSRICCRNISVA